MRLLIAGWQGQVAQALVEAAFARQDVAACAVGRPALDICETRSIERALGDIHPDVLINTAGFTAVDDAEGDAERAFALNRDGARLLAAAAARRGVAIIHLSTDYVFDGTKAAAYVETDPAAPSTVYGRSKLEGELAVAAENPRHVILRTAWVYSPFGQNFVTGVREQARQKSSLRIVADQRGSPTYALHLAAAILDIAKRAAAAVSGAQSEMPWGLYHAAGRGEASWHDVACAVLQESADLGVPGAAVEAIASADYPTRAPRPRNSVLDCAKLAANLGVRLPDWRDGVRECVRRLAVR